MKPEKFKLILNAVDAPVYHNKVLKESEEYILWGEVGAGRLGADDRTAEKVRRFAVDIYTKEEYSELPAEVEKVLEDSGILITDYAVDYETETGYTHYAYTVEG